MMERRRHGTHAGIQSHRALAPSLRQYELDQVQRVTAPTIGKAVLFSSISAPCRDPPGECEKAMP